jgi:hypothetical protein
MRLQPEQVPLRTSTEEFAVHRNSLGQQIPRKTEVEPNSGFESILLRS